MPRLLAALFCFGALCPTCVRSTNAPLQPSGTAERTLAYAEELRLRRACAVPREETPNGDMLVGKPTDEWTGPYFLNAQKRPVKVVIGLTDPELAAVTNARRRPASGREQRELQRVLTASENITAVRTDAQCSSALYVPIWKCATTTATAVMQKAFAACGGQARGPHSPLSEDEGSVEVGGDLYEFQHGPISTNVAVEEFSVRWTIVRDPLERFVSGMIPHGELPLCADGAACPDRITELVEHARTLANASAFPWEMVGSEHWVSQAYFLSATDDTGKLLRFDRVARLETLESDLGEIGAAFGVSFDSKSFVQRMRVADDGVVCENCKGGDEVQRYAEALMQQSSEDVCLVCGVLAHDYECLGYEQPAACKQCGR